MGLKHLQLKTHILNLNLLISKQPNNLATKNTTAFIMGVGEKIEVFILNDIFKVDYTLVRPQKHEEI